MSLLPGRGEDGRCEEGFHLIRRKDYDQENGIMLGIAYGRGRFGGLTW